jgi:methylenetetrahydrofolate reductase (NADH)
MWDKRTHATYIVSNLCFNPVTLQQWIARVRRRGVTLPLLVGLAGPVDRAKLIQMATKIGAAESARFIAGHASWFARLGTPGGYQPERLLTRLAGTLASPQAGVRGLHIFTFNQLRKTEQWRRTLLEPAQAG